MLVFNPTPQQIRSARKIALTRVTFFRAIVDTVNRDEDVPVEDVLDIAVDSTEHEHLERWTKWIKDLRTNPA